MSYFELKSENGITHLKMTRSHKQNALNHEMLEELKKHVRTIEDNEDYVVILSGEGQSFCAGGDISMMEKTNDRHSFSHIMDEIEDIVTELYLMPKMIISAVHGSAVGLGFSIALSTDYILAHEDSKLSMNFIGVGLIPDGGAHFWLQERLGPQKAKIFTWEGKVFEADEALKEGVIDAITTKDVEEAAFELAEKWKKQPLQAMIATKQVYHRNEVQKLLHLMKEERIWQWDIRQTDDHKEAVQAFLEKRKPNFKGQ